MIIMKMILRINSLLLLIANTVAGVDYNNNTFIKAKPSQPRPPGEPDYTSIYISNDFTVTEDGDCIDGSRVWLYTPKVLKTPKPDVIAYLHGYSAAFPFIYQGHIEHLVKQGNYVIFPQFQPGLCNNKSFFKGLKEFFGMASPAEWVEVAVQRVQDTLNTLDSYNQLFLYGHSLGGAFGMMWGDIDAVPNKTDPVAGVFASPQPAGFAAIPGLVVKLFPWLFGEDIDVPAAAPYTLFPIAILHGNDDTIAPLPDILPSFQALGSAEKYIFQAQTDDYGHPALTADHQAATSITEVPNDVDSMDWRYFWSGLDQVIAGTPVGSLVFDMGEWSDGTKVKRVKLLETPTESFVRR